MTDKNYRSHSSHISRRDFLKLAAAAGLLAGCSIVEQPAGASSPSPTSTPLPTDTPIPTETPAPTDTLVLPTDIPLPTATPLPVNTPLPTNTPTPMADPTVSAAARRAEIIKFYPDMPSKVVWADHPDVWNGETLSSEVIHQMLDASITALTGVHDAIEAWSALFDPGERIAIKVNTIAGSSYWTHVPLVMAVSERLQAIGVPPEQIIIFDRYTSELDRAGFTINLDGAGVRCLGTDEQYAASDWTMLDTNISFSPILLDCDALINMPILKQHGITGISFAMKNHYGSFNKPGNFHGTKVARAIPELNALEPIKDRTRLIIGDVLTVVKSGWRRAVMGDSILMSFDPIAHDTLGLQLYGEVMVAEGQKPGAGASLANPWLAYGAELGLGTNDPNNMDIVEVNLG
jgi:hypothetical protein